MMVEGSYCDVLSGGFGPKGLRGKRAKGQMGKWAKRQRGKEAKRLR